MQSEWLARPDFWRGWESAYFAGRLKLRGECRRFTTRRQNRGRGIQSDEQPEWCRICTGAIPRHIEWNTYPNAECNVEPESDGNACSYSYSNSNLDSNCHTNCNRNRNHHARRYGDAYCNADFKSKRWPKPAISSDTGAPAVNASCVILTYRMTAKIDYQLMGELCRVDCRLRRLQDVGALRW